MKRARELSAEQHPAQQQQLQAPLHRTTRRGKMVMFGKSCLTNASSKLSAAKKLFKKAVFCIDNLKADCSESDLAEFIERLGVNVITCSVSKTRLRRNETHEDDAVKARRAFRVCIDAEYTDRLLDPLAWPDSVVISEWYFKQTMQHQQQFEDARTAGKRRRIDSAWRSRDRESTGPSPAESMDASAVGDNTLVYSTASQENAI
jgi:uncharacterized OsmC-like protein